MNNHKKAMFDSSINDYEMIYLIKTFHDEKAFQKLLEQYKPFIYTKIASFRVFDEDREDFLEEGIIALYEAVYSFKEEYNKTFMRFFEMVLERRFGRIRHNSMYYQKMVFVEETNSILNKNSMSLEEECIQYDFSRQFLQKLWNECSSIERIVFQKKYLEHQSVEKIALDLKVDAKYVYNATNRIKMKAKELEIKEKI